MDERSDENLVLACRNSNRQAYASLIERYYRHVFLVCMGILGNVHDAEDIAQDVMLKGFVKIKKLRDGSQFSTWITRIAKNTCINLARRNKRTRRALEQRAARPQETAPQNETLQRAIEKLPSEIRLPLTMYYFDGRSVKNVAQKLNTSSSSIYVKLRTATKQLHEILNKETNNE